MFWQCKAVCNLLLSIGGLHWVACLKTVKGYKMAKTTTTTKATTTNTKVALTPIMQARANVQSKAKEGVGVTLHTTGQAIAGLAAQPSIAKPQLRMCRVITALNGHPGQGNMVKRYHLYKVGQTLLDAKHTQGMVASDITYYAQCGYLTLSAQGCPKAHAKAVAAWQASKLAAK